MGFCKYNLQTWQQQDDYALNPGSSAGVKWIRDFQVDKTVSSLNTILTYYDPSSVIDKWINI